MIRSPALLSPATLAPTAAPTGSLQKNENAETFDAALTRQLEARQTPGEPVATQSTPPADQAPKASETCSQADSEPDQAQISKELQALIASLTLLSPKQPDAPAQPALEVVPRLAPQSTASAGHDKPATVSAETSQNRATAFDALGVGHLQAEAAQQRRPLHAQTTAHTAEPAKPEKLSAGALAAAAEGHAAPIQPTAALPTGPTANALTLQEKAAAPTLHLAPRLGNPGWDQALGQRVLWLAGSGNQQASLTINPPQLGPVQVTMQLQDNQAIASFISAQPEVRQALEAALPKLREMMSEAGLQLSDAQVHAGGASGHGASERGANQAQQPAAASGFGTDGSGFGANETVQTAIATAGLALVDTFA